MRARWVELAGVFALITVLGASSLAHADPCADAQPASDDAVVKSALTARTAAELAGHVADLQAVLARAPGSFPSVDQQGAVLIIRAVGAERGRSLMVRGLMIAGGTPEAAHPGVKAFMCVDTYPIASVLVGSYWNAQKRPDLALAALDKGYALQPGEDGLVTERGVALIQLHRAPEAEAMYDKWLADGVSPDKDRARVLRARGYVRTEANRLEAAEADYRESLKLEPNHAGAKAELAYIAKMRAGGQGGASELSTAGEARAGRPR